MGSFANSAIFAKIHDTVSAGVEKMIDGETPSPSTTAPAAASTPAPTPASPAPAPDPAPAPSSPVAAELGTEEEDEFEFDEDKQPSATPAAAPETPTTTPQTPGTQPTTTPVEGTEDEDSIDWSKMLPQEVEQAFLRHARGKAMLNAFKERRELSKPPSEGGLGFVPTVQQIKEFHQNAANLEAMDYDFQSGTRDGVTNWINYWWEPTQNPQQTKSQAMMAKALPHVLKQVNPDAYRAIGDTFGQQMVEELLTQAKSAATESDRKFYARFARSVHEYIFGDDNAPDVSDLTGDPKPEPPSPEVQRLQTELQQRDQREQESRRKAAQTRVQNNTKNFETAVSTRLTGLIDNALSLVKEKLGQTVYYQPTIESFKKEIETAVQSSPGWVRFQRLRAEAIRSGSPEAVNAANEQYFQLVKPVIRNLRPKYLKDASAFLSRQNSSEHQTRQSAVQNGSTPGGGAAPAAPVTPSGKPERLPNESQRDWIERIARSGIA